MQCITKSSLSSLHFVQYSQSHFFRRTFFILFIGSFLLVADEVNVNRCSPPHRVDKYAGVRDNASHAYTDAGRLALCGYHGLLKEFTHYGEQTLGNGMVRYVPSPFDRAMNVCVCYSKARTRFVGAPCTV